MQSSEQWHGGELRENDEARYFAHMPLPDRQTALRNLAIAFEHYNSVDRTWRLAFKPWLPSVQVAS
jgi:hypothetical protein